MKNSKLKNIVAHRLRWYALLIIGLLLLSQLLALWFFPLELITHFTLHGIIFILLCSFAFVPKWRYLLWILAIGVISVSLFSPQKSLEKSHTQSILSYNINFENQHKDYEIDFLLQNNADILALSEIGGSEWKSQLHTLKQHYPHNCGHDIDSPFAMQILSQLPLIACEVHFVDIYPFIRAVLPQNRSIFLIHPPPPINKELAHDRQEYFHQTATFIANEANPVIVVGDLNNTAYSPIYRKFIQTAQIKDALAIATASWKPLLLPIDRVLYRNIEVVAKPLSWQYSDHRPILTKMQLSD